MNVQLKPVNLQTIVITGGTSGIGLCTAKHAAAQGAKVIIVSRNEKILGEVVEQIRAEGGEADYVVADVGEREQIRHVVDTVIERHGGFDTWVNNAGVGIFASLEETSDEDHHRIFKTNYWGVVYGSLEAVRHLKTRGGGALINVGSVSSEMSASIPSAHMASKHAVKGFTEALRLELMHEDVPVSVTLIKPGGIHTPFGEHARNYMPVRSFVPPHVYHPNLVAKAILRAAAHPTREITAGESGLMMTALTHLLPGLSDWLYSEAFHKTAKEHERPRGDGSNGLHQPGSDGRILGDQNDRIHETSLYTEAQIHPGAARAIGGVALAALATALFVNRRQTRKQTRRHAARRRR